MSKNKVTVYHSSAGFPVLRSIDEGHTPYTKRPGEVKSQMNASLTYCSGECAPGVEGNKTRPWLEIRLEETTNGRSRVLSTYLHGEEIEQLLKLFSEPRLKPDFHRPTW